MANFEIEKSLSGPIIGLDEVGRGPLAGPVISCGCYFKNYSTQEDFYNLIGDSKKLTEKKRKISFVFLQNLKKEGIIDYHLGIARSKEEFKLLFLLGHDPELALKDIMKRMLTTMAIVLAIASSFYFLIAYNLHLELIKNGFEAFL